MFRCPGFERPPHGKSWRLLFTFYCDDCARRAGLPRDAAWTPR